MYPWHPERSCDSPSADAT
jgi:alpha-ketoglutarate-dependent taurine dioxygenase